MPESPVNHEKGLIFGHQRFSIHDGPGIRTCVFFKGCNLFCSWCHNPEGICGEAALDYGDTKCIHCGSCVPVCPVGAHEMIAGKHHFWRERCTACGQCTEGCPAGALKLAGQLVDTDEVMQIVRRDRKFYDRDGGVTLSGGEALLQLDFALALLKSCRYEKIHTVVETNGVHEFTIYQRVMPWVDLFLYDYKMTDPDQLARYTGADQNLVLSNLKGLHDAGARVQLRCPIISGLNDTDAHFRAIAQLTLDLPGLTGAEILPYHNLGVAKSEHLGQLQAAFAVADPETVQSWKQKLIHYGARLVHAD
jgi:pyruvate formate lyase activating enzyme